MERSDRPAPRRVRESPRGSKTPAGVSRRSLLLIALMTLAVILLAVATILVYRREPVQSEDTSTPSTSSQVSDTSDLSSDDQETIYQQNLQTIQDDPPSVPDEYRTVYASLLGSLQEYPQLMDVFYQIEDYPMDMLTMLVNYKETLQTVLDYPALKGTYDPTLTQEEIDGFAAGDPVLLIQWDERWAYYPMYSSLLCWAGCGPTTLSMAYMTLTGDTSYTPDVMAELAVERGYYVEGQGSNWSLFSDGAADLGLTSTTLSLSESSMKSALDSGALIAVNFGPGDFTTGGHYALIVGYDDEGFRINDPNSIIRSNQSWTYERLESQIKNLWKLSGVRPDMAE